MLTGPAVILGLKVAVGAVTALLVASVVAVARGRYRLHGRLNLAFFTLTLAALLVFEVILRVVSPEAFDYIHAHPDLQRSLNIHLCFAVPAALTLPAMLYSGMAHRRALHLTLAALFGVLWVGTFVTGIFFL